jgi:hypothetical protein
MTITIFRELLAKRLDELEKQVSAMNGRSTSNEFGDYRGEAGRTRGLREAAQIVREFQLEEDDG